MKEKNNYVRGSLVLLLAATLSACGGGGGNPGTTSGGSGGAGGSGGSGGSGGATVSATPTLTLAFTNASGAASNSLTAGAPLSVKATVLDKDKKPVPNAIVTFATDNTLGVFSPTAGTALTDASGVASVTMTAANLSAGGAGAVTATSTVAGSTITGTSNYAVGATSLAFGTPSASPSSLQAYGTTTLSVPVLAGGAAYTAQPVKVSFNSTCVAAGKATMASVVSTSTRDGTAQAVYRDKGCASKDTITVTADGVTRSISIDLDIAEPPPASVQFLNASPVSQSIVIKGNGGINRTETAILTFKVVDSFGNPLPGKTVRFARVPANVDVTVNKACDTTDASGNVATTVNSGTTATSFRVQSTLVSKCDSTDLSGISTLSDSVVVTTGLPVQRAFSLAPGSYNVDGSLDKPEATTLQVMLADDFSNPVPDGTPIVFQTNLGAVGSSDKGGCNTLNGMCSVYLRTQNPRTATPGLPRTPCNAVTADSTRPGLATICASSTDGTNTVYARTAVFFSYNRVVYAYMDGSSSALDLSRTTDLGSISGSATKVFTLQLNDQNQNPLPAGSKVEITSMLNANAAAVVPATVPIIAPHHKRTDDVTGITVSELSENQGSTHTFSISSTNLTSCTPAQASFNVSVTTPTGSVTNIPFKLSFTCP